MGGCKGSGKGIGREGTSDGGGGGDGVWTFGKRWEGVGVLRWGGERDGNGVLGHYCRCVDGLCGDGHHSEGVKLWRCRYNGGV